MNGSFSLRKSYLFLIVLAGLFSTFSFLAFYEGQWASGFLSDFAAGIFGSLIIIFFVDQIIERNRQRERVKVAKIALKRVRFPILWYTILHACMHNPQTEQQTSPLGLQTT